MTTEDDLYIAWTKITSTLFLYYFSLSLTSCGLVFNTIQIIVFARKKFSGSNMGFYFIALGIFNNLALIMIFVFFFGASIGQDITVISTTSCSVIMYLVRIIPQIPSWLEVLVTFDRLVYVLQVKRLEFLKRKRVICVLIGLVVVMLATINFANLEFFVTETDTVTNVTVNGTNETLQTLTMSLACTSYKQVVLMRDVLAICIRTIIPFILIVAANTKLIKALFDSRKKFMKPEATSTVSDAKHKHMIHIRKEYSFLMSIVALDFFFVSVLIPLAVTLILLDFYNFIPSWSTPTRKAAAQLAYYISFYISSLPYGLGFVVNLIFNKIFRKEFIKMVFEVRVVFSKFRPSISQSSTY